MNANLKHRPPAAAKWLLKRMSHFQNDYHMAGDFEEVYYHQLAMGNTQSARIWFWMQVLSCLPGYLSNMIYWRITMFHSYFKSAIRHLFKNRLYTVISVIGLSLAVGSFSVTFVFVDALNNSDTFHDDVDKIFNVNIMIDRSGNTQLWGPTPVPLGPAMKEDFVQVEDFVRIRHRNGTLKYGDKTFEEQFMFVDDAFLNMFSFPLLKGDKALSTPNGIIITDEIALKYFGDENPIGKSMTILNSDRFQDEFVVKGIVERCPKASSIFFWILLPYERIEDWENTDITDWSTWTHTFIRVSHPNDIADIKMQMDKYVQTQNAANETWSVQKFVFEPLKTMARNSHMVTNRISGGPPPSSTVAMFVFGFSLLLLACINYVNIGVVTSTRRLREIGVRKVLGSTRSKLITQFISENVLLCSLSIVLGALFAGLYLVPAFNRMFGAPLSLNILENSRLWIFYLSILFVTAFVSGGYPAFYVSRFNPVNILRKNEKVGGGSKLTKSFLTFQFILTFLMLSAGLIFVNVTNHLEQMDWGYNQEQVINIRMKNNRGFEAFRNEIVQNPNIMQTAGSKSHIGRSMDIDVVHFEDKEYEIRSFKVGYEYLQTLQLRLRSGRGFEKQLGTDRTALVVNERFVRDLNIENPIGQVVTIGDNEFIVIGVVENFYYRVMAEPIHAAMFRISDPKAFEFVSARVKPGASSQTMTFLEEKWKVHFPDQPFNAVFQNAIWDNYFRENKCVHELSLYVATVALIISCMGLFGLISISILKRTKEVSIRRVLGASAAHIVKLLNRDLVIMLIIALCVSIPLSYFFMRQFVDMAYSFDMPIDAVPFILSACILIFTALLTVSSQLMKAARTDVVAHLKNE